MWIPERRDNGAEVDGDRLVVERRLAREEPLEPICPSGSLVSWRIDQRLHPGKLLSDNGQDPNPALRGLCRDDGPM